MKATWRVINSVLKNQKICLYISQYFVRDDKKIYDQSKKVKKLNQYYVNVLQLKYQMQIKM